MKKTVGERLRELRVENGYTPTQLACLLGVSTSSLSSYENGIRPPRDEVKKKYALIFKKSIQELFYD